jgi:hypothetical protein
MPNVAPAAKKGRLNRREHDGTGGNRREQEGTEKKEDKACRLVPRP